MGGTVVLDAKDGGRSGIYGSRENIIVNINGGSLNINNATYGVSLNGGDNKINFNGGTTIIKNPETYAVDLRHLDDPENAISFGQGMGIKEPNLYVFWEDEEIGIMGWTGIVAEDILTIAEGGTVKKYYGWDIGEIDPEVDDDVTDVKVPDTGVFSSENGGVIVAAVSLGAVELLAGGLYGIRYAIERRSMRVGFQKRQY